MAKIIDATNLILGRLATRVAKLALMGEEIVILNCEKAVISGKRHVVLAKFKEREARTQATTGPWRVRMPDRIVRKVIKGMMPHGHWSEESKGRVAFEKVKCFLGVPKEYVGKPTELMPRVSADKLKSPFYTTVGEISALIRQRNG